MGSGNSYVIKKVCLQARRSPDRTEHSYQGKGKTLRRDIERRIERIQAEQRKINQRENELMRKEQMILWGILPKEALPDSDSSMCKSSEKSETESRESTSSSKLLESEGYVGTRKRKLAVSASGPPSRIRKIERDTIVNGWNAMKSGSIIDAHHKPADKHYNLRPRSITKNDLANDNLNIARKRKLEADSLNHSNEREIRDLKTPKRTIGYGMTLSEKQIKNHSTSNERRRERLLENKMPDNESKLVIINTYNLRANKIICYAFEPEGRVVLTRHKRKLLKERRGRKRKNCSRS